jgi:hypothetical protein
MTVRVGINGFGRVGRSFVRAVQDQDADMEVASAVTTNPGGTGKPARLSSPRLAPFPPTRPTSARDTSANQATKPRAPPPPSRAGVRRSCSLSPGPPPDHDYLLSHLTHLVGGRAL